MDESARARWREELYIFCGSESLSEEGLREIFERHGLTPNTIYPPSRDYRLFLHRACYNERVNEGIIRCLIEYFPDAAVGTTRNEWSPLHVACGNKSVTINIVQLLIDAAPDSLRSVDSEGWVPLHYLCMNKSVNKSTLVDILKVLIEKCPEGVRHADNYGCLPIHLAAKTRSPEFCRVLIEAYPGSERIGDSNGLLPLHIACCYNSFASVEYFSKLYPDAINHATTGGMYPIHYATSRISDRNKLTGAVEILQFLLDCDPNVKFQMWRGASLLCAACLQTNYRNYNDPNTIVVALDVVKAIYDAYPEAIEGERIVRDTRHYHVQAQVFINSEIVYARQARDRSLMTTPDDNGRLPLHKALQNNVRLGSIKLLVKGNPSAIRSFDERGVIPLHVACEHHESSSVVGYINSLSGITLDTTDRQGNTALHYACRGAKYDTIALLMDKFDAVSVSKRNADEKLPIDLLWESNEVLDRESVAYTESVYRLLRAYPETTMRFGLQAQSDSASCPRPKPTGKKRKLDDD